ncbi:MAG: UDP-2,3-diacylglucosamine diphosphatase LpxI [Candidatus Omnitrophota bacterium]
MEKIGLIAGNRKFPLVVAQGAKKNGLQVVAVAIKRDTSPELKQYVDKIYWIGLGELTRMCEIFREEGIRKVVMAGQISPHRLFSKEVSGSEDLKKLLDSLKDKKADSIFEAVARKLEEFQIELLDSTVFVRELLPKKGALTLRLPDPSDWEDIHFGFDLAKEIARLDIGQTVAVKSKAVVAVEALEGTDNLIRRAGKISRGAFLLVKVSKPRQDMRFDIPVVGLNTIKNLVKTGAKGLAFEAEKTLFIDLKESVNLADRKGLTIVAL